MRKVKIMDGKTRVVTMAALGLSCTVAVAADLASFPSPWTSPYHVDPDRPFQLVNTGGEHLFIVNKTAWLYSGCKNPEAVLDRAIEQGVNVLREGMEDNALRRHYKRGPRLCNSISWAGGPLPEASGGARPAKRALPRALRRSPRRAGLA